MGVSGPDILVSQVHGWVVGPEVIVLVDVSTELVVSAMGRQLCPSTCLFS
jgi:hypothetical protein